MEKGGNHYKYRKRDNRMKHLHKWIGTLMGNLDQHLDEETKVKVLENCGRACITQNLIKKAKVCNQKAKDMNDFLDKFGKIYSHLQKEGDNIYIVYPKCYCPLVKDYPGSLSPTWCNCSRGWVKQLFESALERPVQVELEKSIVQGDDCCRFKVRL